METDRTWIVTAVDGMPASVAPDYSGLLQIAATLAGHRQAGPKAAKTAKAAGTAEEVRTWKCSTAELVSFGASLKWEELMPFGTEFQKKVWHRLFQLNHGEEPRLYSYSEFARCCGMEKAVRAVAHAVAKNPLPVILPCHRIVPKESVDLIAEIERAASKTIFNGADIWLFDSVSFGEYSLGKQLKRELLAGEFSYGIPKE